MNDAASNPRRLLVLSNAEGDPSLARQRELLSGAEESIRDRDLRVEYLTGAGAGEVRRERGVEQAGFVVLLVGRDGGVKHRYGEPVSPEEIFARIDEMPMRKREMRERDGA